MLTHGSLFSGIGGFDLGFERAGIETIWQVEIEDYARRVLQRHFPRAQRFNDIRECGKHNLAPVDIVAGGFPCQDISDAGSKAGIEGERSGLWSEMHRVIGELRPRYIVVENVAALLGRGMGRVLADLAANGYDSEWGVFCARDFGLPHRRERVFIVAYPHSFRRTGNRKLILEFAQPGAESGYGNQWDVAPSRLCGMDDGLSARLDRLRAVGNAIVPNIAEWIGRRIVAAVKRESLVQQGH